MKSSDIKVGGEYAHVRSNYHWDGCYEDSITRVEVIEPIEWIQGPSWNRKKLKGFRVKALNLQVTGGQQLFLKVTARELRSTWADFQERLQRVNEMRASREQAEFNEHVQAYVALKQVDRAIRKLDTFRDSKLFEFYTDQEMFAARAAGWEVEEGVTPVVMDIEVHYGRAYLRPHFKVSRRDVLILAEATQ